MSFNPDRINIHELTIEEPEKQAEAPFDVERDITEEDWEKMDEWRKRQMKGNWQVVAEICAEETILGRPPKLHEDDMQKLKEEREKERSKPVVGWLDFAKKSSDESIMGKTPQLSEDDWKNIIKKREEWRLIEEDRWRRDGIDTRNVSYFIGFITSETLLGRSPELSEDDWKYLSDFKEKNRRNIGNLIDVLKVEALLGRKPKLSNQDWEFIKAEREKLRHEPSFGFMTGGPFWHNSIKCAVTMAILSADEIKIPEEGGLKLIYNKNTKLTQDTPPIPEIKKY